MKAAILAVWASPVFKSALSGLASAATVDYHAFTTWKSIQDALKYQWGTALFRWGQGFIVGGFTGLATNGFGFVLAPAMVMGLAVIGDNIRSRIDRNRAGR